MRKIGLGGRRKAVIKIGPAAAEELRQLLSEHPEESVVRIVLHEPDTGSRSFQISLDASPHPQDVVQDLDGLIICLEGQNAQRMRGVTLEYDEPEGFRFVHPPPDEDGDLIELNLN